MHTHHPSPGKPYKGGTFTGRLFTNSEGELLCRMLKAAFRRGMMFILGKEGKVVLDGVSLFNGSVNVLGWIEPDYASYTQKLNAELAAKGITEVNIDQTEELYETLTFDGQHILDALLSS
ncbi:E3 ubiquitin-protein ligase DTX3L-like [Mya arenaria]|uniref:E3 ubiquitin-protein ligase DTX3L-like n=1 Tax=Mya arenaria TaxID=6604 RepID=UPI0022E0B18E|nr:E3 ubiquitin-protein ligase DTX3L-like [Mya arenaria]